MIHTRWFFVLFFHFISSRFFANFRDTIDSVKQSSALCLLRLLRTSGDLIHMGEWASRVIHLLNDQHMVRLRKKMRAQVDARSRVFSLVWPNRYGLLTSVKETIPIGFCSITAVAELFNDG